MICWANTNRQRWAWQGCSIWYHLPSTQQHQQQIALDKGNQLLHQLSESDKHLVPIQHMVAGFNALDSPLEKNVAAHPNLLQFLWEWGNFRKGTILESKVVGDAALIIFHYLLLVEDITVKGWQH